MPIREGREQMGMLKSVSIRGFALIGRRWWRPPDPGFQGAATCPIKRHKGRPRNSSPPCEPTAMTCQSTTV